MIKISNIDTLVKLIDDFNRDSIQFKSFSNSYAHSAGLQVMSNKQTEDNRWTVKIAVLSTIGTFYYEQTFNLKDEEELISEVKTKISKVIFAPNVEISLNDGILTIK